MQKGIDFIPLLCAYSCEARKLLYTMSKPIKPTINSTPDDALFENPYARENFEEGNYQEYINECEDYEANLEEWKGIMEGIALEEG